MQYIYTSITYVSIYILPGIPGVSMSQFSYTSPKTNMDTQNHALERWTALRNMAMFIIFWVSMLDFWGLYTSLIYHLSKDRMASFPLPWMSWWKSWPRTTHPRNLVFFWGFCYSPHKRHLPTPNAMDENLPEVRKSGGVVGEIFPNQSIKLVYLPKLYHKNKPNVGKYGVDWILEIAQNTSWKHGFWEIFLKFSQWHLVCSFLQTLVVYRNFLGFPFQGFTKELF